MDASAEERVRLQLPADEDGCADEFRTLCGGDTQTFVPSRLLGTLVGANSSQDPPTGWPAMKTSPRGKGTPPR